MTPETAYEYSLEQIQVIREAQQIEALMNQPGWVLVEHIFTALQASAHAVALNCPTSDPAAALDALRKWQITDEVVSSVRANILQTIQNAKDMAPQNDLEREALKERLYGRTDDLGSSSFGN